VKSLALKTIAGFLNLFFCLALLLFAPARTLHFWQAWVYLLVFFISCAWITLYLWKKDPALLERRVKAGPTAEKETSQKLIQFLATLAFVGTMIVPSLDRRFGWSHVPLALVVAGDMLAALGFWIVFVVYRENTFAGATIGVAAGQTVISSGPYALIRHPMYSGALVMLLGTPLALGSWWGLFMFFPMLGVIVFRLLDEEKFLGKSLPGYDEYCQKVRYRLAPYLW
jgi:protein-S-isoprenylcysteine O-methyltransferase Ste14